MPGRSTSCVGKQRDRIYTRIRTNAYFSASVGLVFFAAFFVYIGYPILAVCSAVTALVSFPLLSVSDRLCFDGKRVYRTGIVWKLTARALGQRQKVKPREIIHVETETFRMMRRGANIVYRYRVLFHTSEHIFAIGSGRGFRRMIAELLPIIPDNCLDVRSQELRDHYPASVDVAIRARRLQIPRSDVLDANTFFNRERRARVTTTSGGSDDLLLRAEELRAVANQLRTTGRLLQALEAFRRGLRIAPSNGRLIYEFARCLHSLAASRRDATLNRKAQAMLRLAERRSGRDSELLLRLGETYFSMGALRRAESAFKKAAESGHNSYRVFRGLGELALRDGRIAHAVNYFSNAARLDLPAPQRRWARSEAEYLRNLNDNEEYMDLEVSRLNLYDNLEGARTTSRRIFVFGTVVTVFGLFLPIDLVAEIGWAVSAVSLSIWLAASVLRHMFATRIPFELVDGD